MRRWAQHPGYLRLRAFLGTIYAFFGIVIIARTCSSVGLRPAEIPALVLGAALMGLGVLRVREYLALRENASP